MNFSHNIKDLILKILSNVLFYLKSVSKKWGGIKIHHNRHPELVSSLGAIDYQYNKILKKSE